MPIYKIKLIDKETVANNTVRCNFEKPAELKFIAGQYGGFTLIDPPNTDAQGNTRRFSLLSTPDEATLSIVTRIQTSAFKQTIANMSIGDEIKFAGPTGNFVLHENAQQPAVFIAGGIGIAPFFSMIRDTYHNNPERKITLFYGNQSKATTAFFAELNQLANDYEHFSFIPVMAEDDSWEGEKGFITHTLIKQHVSDMMTPMFYVCGSPAMVGALQELLLEMDIPGEHIQVEDFPGY